MTTGELPMQTCLTWVPCLTSLRRMLSRRPRFSLVRTNSSRSSCRVPCLRDKGTSNCCAAHVGASSQAYRMSGLQLYTRTVFLLQLLPRMCDGEFARWCDRHPPSRRPEPGGLPGRLLCPRGSCVGVPRREGRPQASSGQWPGHTRQGPATACDSRRLLLRCSHPLCPQLLCLAAAWPGSCTVRKLHGHFPRHKSQETGEPAALQCMP